MCGRYSLTSGEIIIGDYFGVKANAPIPDRYNIAPRQPILIVRQGPSGKRELAAAEWGLVPEWKKTFDPNARPLINARVETVTEKASFRSPVKRTRCLVPFSGWYEWKTVSGRKQPWYFEPTNSAPVHAFAGIWTVWHGPGAEHWLETVSFLTAESTGPLSKIHHRKPLVVDPCDFDRWLTPTDPLPKGFIEQTTFLPETAFQARKCSSKVNNVRVDGPACIGPPEEDNQFSLL